MAATTNDGNPVVYRARYDPNRERPPSEAVVEAIAAAENVEPTELDVRLYDSVDPEALDRLYETAGERSDRLRVSFAVAGYEVVVIGDGSIVVRDGSESCVR